MQLKARVFEDEFGQAVQLPDGYRFDTEEVYLRHDPQTGALTFSEKPLEEGHAEEMGELFRHVNALGGFEFEVERDSNLHAERDSF